MEVPWGNGGWQPDAPDHRDYTLEHPTVQKLMRRLRTDADQREAPSRVDWREYCGPVDNQAQLPTSSAHAAVGLLQYFARRCAGESLRPSRLFVHYNASRLMCQPPTAGVSLRAALQSTARFGGPDEEYWPYHRALLRQTPTAFAYAFSYRFKGLRYSRLDAFPQTPERLLQQSKSFLTAGFALAFGFAASDALGHGPEVPFPTVFDHIRHRLAAVAVGYDDHQRIHSEKGAFLIRSPLGATWGESGYGWLPYRFQLTGLARDWWTLLKPSWLKSGELDLPRLG